MPRISSLLLLAACFGVAHPAIGQQTPQIKYISKEALYINAGSDNGFALGDTLRIFRDNRLIGLATIVHISATSSACRLIKAIQEPRIGDVVKASGARRSPSRIVQPERSASPARSSQRQPQARTERRNSANRISGYVAMQSYWLNPGAWLASFQPSFSGRLKITNLGGTGLEFRLRQRSRLYHRTIIGEDADQVQEWTHRFFEAALVYNVPDSPWEFGFGRVYSPRIRGIGYIDGAHVAIKAQEHLRVGVAAGREPRDEFSGPGADRLKVGAFLTFEKGAFDRQRLESSIAFSSSYESGAVNREFVYLQNSYRLANRLSLYQSVEIDVNRSWRLQSAGRRFSFTNFFVNANLFITSSISAYLGYDARTNVRTLAFRSTPDSLFDDLLRRGVNGGIAVNLPRNMRAGARLSVRFQDADMQNSLASSLYWSIPHLIARGHTLVARFTYVDAQFIRAYRPAITYRLPVTRHFSLMLGGGGYINKIAAQSITSYFAEAQSYYSFLRRFFLSAHYRQTFDTDLQNKQIFLEAGAHF